MQQRMQYSSKAEFGQNSQEQIAVRITQCEGPFQDFEMAIAHLGMIVDSAVKLEGITLVTDDSWSKGKTNEIIKTSFESDDVKIRLEIEFKLASRQISRRDLTAIVHGNIMPAALQTVGYYVAGDSQLVAKPSTGFNAVTPRSSSLLGRLDEVLADNDSSRRTRQLAKR